MEDLRREEEEARRRDEADVRHKRAAARQLARERGLVVSPEPDEAEQALHMSTAAESMKILVDSAQAQAQMHFEGGLSAVGQGESTQDQAQNQNQDQNQEGSTL